MVKNLVIVESPAKAKTIEKFLGKEYEVKSSYGHIRDLPKKGMNIDIEHDFSPNYQIAADKKKIVNELKKSAKGKEVYLASDEDREGEAIAWHLANILGLDATKTKRIVFHEITDSAIKNAIIKPRTIDLNLVNAQQARRIIDRLVGYELSPVLWKKIKTGLSAGRVQSVAVRLIVDREKEITDFQSKASYKVTADFISNNQSFKAELDKNLEVNYEENKEWLTGLINSKFTVNKITQKPALRNPSAPFTTSTLQQEASRRLGYSVRQTMNLAQRLYENGHISYMRTDSTTLASQTINNAKEYILKNFGQDYLETRQYQTKNSSAQEAHEAIRPTNFNNLTIPEDDQQDKLYRLIWQRTLASQMKSCKTKKTEAFINISTKKEYFVAKGEVLEFDGFSKVYGNRVDDSILPDIKEGQILEYDDIISEEKLSRARGRYSEASLVRKLEELGIGRPSTYSPTITTIQNRGYVEKKDIVGETKEIRVITLKDSKISESKDNIIYGADKSKLAPTAIATITNDFLTKYFPSIVDYAFTADIETKFDTIASGQEPWVKVVDTFYSSFHPLVEKSEQISRKEVAKARLIGNDPKDNEPIYARFGRYGPMIQKGEISDDKEIKPVFASMPEGYTIETVDLKSALKALGLPRTLGKTEDNEDILVNIGRFGPYIQIAKKYISIKDSDPYTIDLAEALDKIKEYKEKESKKRIKDFENGLAILNGPYGAYLTDGKKNARISKDIDIDTLDQYKAKEILDKAPLKNNRFKKRTKK